MCRNIYEAVVLINSGKKIRSITKETIEVLPVSDHKEGDAR